MCSPDEKKEKELLIVKEPTARDVSYEAREED